MITETFKNSFFSVEIQMLCRVQADLKLNRDNNRYYKGGGVPLLLFFDFPGHWSYTDHCVTKELVAGLCLLVKQVKDTDSSRLHRRYVVRHNGMELKSDLESILYFLT